MDNPSHILDHSNITQVNPMSSQITQAIINTHTKIQKRIGNALSAHGIGLSEYMVLAELFNSDSQAMRRIDLANRVGLSPSGITRLLNPMEKIGLVSKEANPRDARVSLVAMTDAGKRIFAESKTTYERESDLLFSNLPKSESAQLCALLSMI